ncbi:uncharacterized protein LOC131877222 isoform X2 [Tigriopus californicus]|uniref:uncharacterized protein LOC131877222 isoform X2 n=1 Tax=Tigriopus californicus TaxID=6832 RepID=UPI0027DA2597|nr:uncharacterized protein LOC131877222 isoform X2 [Tigriopus californicus]
MVRTPIFASTERRMSCWERIKWHIRVHGVNEVYPVPSGWIAILSGLHLFCFALIILGEAILSADEYLKATNTDGLVVSAMGSSLVVNSLVGLIFICGPNERKLLCLFVSSCFSSLVLCFLVFMAEDDLIFFQRVNAFYLNDIPQGKLSAQTLAFGAVFDHESLNSTVPMAFPPTNIVVLSVFKAIGTFFGLVVSKLMIATVLWIKFDVLYELPDQLIEEPTAEECEDDEQDQSRRAQLAKLGGLLTLGFLACSVSLYLSTSVVNAISVIDLNFILFLTRVKFIFCYFVCILALLILEFKLYPSEVREFKLIVFSSVIMIIVVFMVAIVKDIQVHSSMLTNLSQPPGFNSDQSTPFCVQSCSLSPPESCTPQCIPREQYCDGIVHLQNPLRNLSNLHFYRSISDPSMVLLFPDELYCAWRLNLLLNWSYIVSGLVFVSALILIFRSRGLLAFMCRRQRRKKAKQQRALTLRRSDDSDNDYGTMDH